MVESVVGLVVLGVFYAAVLAVGFAASHWYRKRVLEEDAAGTRGRDPTEVNIVAGRRLGGVVGVFTMTGTRLVTEAPWRHGWDMKVECGLHKTTYHKYGLADPGFWLGTHFHYPLDV